MNDKVLKMISLMFHIKEDDDYSLKEVDYSFDEDVEDVLFQIYILLLTSYNMTEEEKEKELDNIIRCDYNKLSEEQKEYIKADLTDLINEHKKHNLERERK